jgi:hypothetical protein
MSETKCVLRCGNVIAADNSSKEHIILNAIGGRKVVSGFICDCCNHGTGATWDAELTRQLNPISLLLGIRRTRGNVPSQVFPTSDGGQVQLNHDGRMTIARPQVERTVDGNNTHVRVHARSKQELRRVIKGILRKHYPQKIGELDDLVATAQDVSRYSDAMFRIDLEFGGPEAGRSLVKSAVALTFDAGVDPHECDLALDYLQKGSGKPCFGYYYDPDNDVVIDRPSKTPFHCAHVTGNPDTAMILGYIEFYGLHRMVMCLSESYSGKAFRNTYALNPVTGGQLALDIELEMSNSDIRSVYNYEKFDEETRDLAAINLFDYICEIDFDKALDRAIASAVDDVWARLDPSQDLYLNSERITPLIDEVIRGLAPFVRHNIEKFGIPRS